MQGRQEPSSKDTDRSSNSVDDDGENLVRQVIAENPIADVGVREEWEQQIGWHQKENIFASGKNKRNRLRGKKSFTLTDLAKTEKLLVSTVMNDPMKTFLDVSAIKRPPLSSITDAAGGSWLILTGIILSCSLLLLSLLLWNCRHHQSRRRYNNSSIIHGCDCWCDKKGRSV